MADDRGYNQQQMGGQPNMGGGMPPHQQGQPGMGGMPHGDPNAAAYNNDMAGVSDAPRNPLEQMKDKMAAGVDIVKEKAGEIAVKVRDMAGSITGDKSNSG